jgi:enediyne biosynthesis protein E4
MRRGSVGNPRKIRYMLSGEGGGGLRFAGKANRDSADIFDLREIPTGILARDTDAGSAGVTMARSVARKIIAPPKYLTRRSFLRGTAVLCGSAMIGPPQASSADDAPIRMVNGTPGTGLDFVLRNGATGRKYQVETMPGGLGVIDFDGDGWPDLFCANGAALPSLAKSGPEYWNRLYRNNRDGTFTDVTAAAGLQGTGYDIGVAVGDYDNDGHQDLLVLGVRGNTLYHNNGNGTFTDVTRQAGLTSLGQRLWSVAAAWIDYDNDGRLDLFISNYVDWMAGADPVCGGLGPQQRSYCHPDMYKPEPMQLFHNNGDGTFTQVKDRNIFPLLTGKGMGIAVADFEAAGRPGLFIANDNAPNLLLRSRGHAALEEIGLDAGVAYNTDGRSISGMGADFGDIDGDGRPDIIVTGLKNEGWEVFLNQGKGSFTDGSAQTGILSLSRPFSGWGCGLVDLDNDGWLDWFTAGGGLDTDDEQSNRIFRNTGGRFTDVTESVGSQFQVPRLHRGVAFADFDRDGRIDAAVTALNAPIELWWNRSPLRHWLLIRLEGVKSNRSAIGARVQCIAAHRTQFQWVRSSVGYASSSDLTVHFGLGEATSAELEVHWPSGAIQKVGQVAADQLLHLKEPLA